MSPSTIALIAIAAIAAMWAIRKYHQHRIDVRVGEITAWMACTPSGLEYFLGLVPEETWDEYVGKDVDEPALDVVEEVAEAA